MNYRYGGKQKTLTMEIYPDLPVVVACERCAKAHKLLRQGIDLNASKSEVVPAQADDRLSGLGKSN